MDMTLRGKCREYSEKLMTNNPGKYRLARGWYYCWAWGKQEHYWCVDIETNKVVDPTINQFPKPHVGQYVEYSGYGHCEVCDKEMHEDDAI